MKALLFFKWKFMFRKQLHDAASIFFISHCSYSQYCHSLNQDGLVLHEQQHGLRVVCKGYPRPSSISIYHKTFLQVLGEVLSVLEKEFKKLPVREWGPLLLSKITLFAFPSVPADDKQDGTTTKAKLSTIGPQISMKHETLCSRFGGSLQGFRAKHTTCPFTKVAACWSFVQYFNVSQWALIVRCHRVVLWASLLSAHTSIFKGYLNC